MANRALPGYEMPVGVKKEITLDHDGPASYSNIVVNAGTGDVITAADIGMGGIETVDVDSLSSDGLNYVWVEYINGGNGNAVPSIRLRWIVLSSNAEVGNTVNLSSKSIRLRFRGV